MNLSEIRQRTNDRLNQAVGQFYPDEYLDRVINEAYRDIANEIETMGLGRSGEDTSIDVAVTPAAREYRIHYTGYPPKPPVAAIVDVTRIRDAGEDHVEIRPYSMRNTPRPGWENDCYVYRRTDSDYEWTLGTIAQEPATQTLRVYYRGQILELSSEHAEPKAVPPDHRDIIAVRAAMIVLEDENREIGNLAAIYVEKMDRMRRCLSGAVKGHASKPW